MDGKLRYGCLGVGGDRCSLYMWFPHRTEAAAIDCLKSHHVSSRAEGRRASRVLVRSDGAVAMTGGGRDVDPKIESWVRLSPV